MENEKKILDFGREVIKLKRRKAEDYNKTFHTLIEDAALGYPGSISRLVKFMCDGLPELKSE